MPSVNDKGQILLVKHSYKKEKKKKKTMTKVLISTEYE